MQMDIRMYANDTKEHTNICHFIHRNMKMFPKDSHVNKMLVVHSQDHKNVCRSYRETYEYMSQEYDIFSQSFTETQECFQVYTAFCLLIIQTNVKLFATTQECLSIIFKILRLFVNYVYIDT